MDILYQLKSFIISFTIRYMTSILKTQTTKYTHQRIQELQEVMQNSKTHRQLPRVQETRLLVFSRTI